MRRTPVAALAFVLFATSALGAGGVAVPMDEVRTVTFGRAVATVYVGNPMIADVNIIDSRHAFILGKSFGKTNIVALDATGHQVSNTVVSVSAGNGGVVTLTKGTAQTTLACSGQRCQPAPLPGEAHYSDVMGDLQKHIDMGSKGTQQ
ncbi:MAG: pilus assembly protein N-terminal domain-containing protein [Rhizomicrobium sp.]